MFRRIIVITVFFFFFFSGAGFYILEEEWADFSSLSNYDIGKPSVLLDNNGKVFARFELDKREFVHFRKLSPVLIKAFIAAEDHNFFGHPGISIKGIIRSFIINLYHRRKLQGASTITQQVARLLFFNSERTVFRKVKEVFTALQLEQQLTKQQIFELYINNIYFGRGIYGVEAACRRFWNKSVGEINMEEAATLAAVAKSARQYSPLNEPENAKQRRNIILRSMFLLNFISNEEYKEAIEKELNLCDVVPGNPIRLYIQEWIRAWAERKWERETLYRKGLRIQTTINLDMQKAAEESFSNVIGKWRKIVSENLNGGMIAIDSHTGKIRALIGGINFNESQFNRAFQAVRQTGSSFKPIVYATALQKGLSLCKTFSDEPLSLEMPGGQIWSPRNATNEFDGDMTLLRALTISNNIVTVKLFQEIGAESVINLAKEFGITRQLLEYPSLALGTAEATVEENVAAFNIFSNNGIYVKPYLVEWVKDELGSKLWSHISKKRKVLDSVTNSKMINALTFKMKRAKKMHAPHEWFDSKSIGKTGSTNDSVTNWFVGATPEFTTAIYVGRDDNKGMGRNVFGNQTSFPIWLNFYRSLTFKEKNFYFDPSLKEVAINWFTGEIANEKDDLGVVTILQ